MHLFALIILTFKEVGGGSWRVRRKKSKRVKERGLLFVSFPVLYTMSLSCS